MSQPVVNCAKCGKPKALTTQQARKGEPVTINGQRLGVPDLPLWVPSTENSATPATEGLVIVNGRRLGVPPMPSLVPSTEPVTINERRMGVPDLPSWVPSKEAAFTTNQNRQGVPVFRIR